MMFLKVTKTVLSLIFVAIAVIIIMFIWLANSLDLREPLSISQVSAAAQRENPERIVRRCTLMQGGRAGDIGYYFIEFEPTGYMTIINDARFSLNHERITGRRGRNMESSHTLLSHIYEYRVMPVSIRSTVKLKLKSLFNKIFNISTCEQNFWAKFKR